MRMGELLQHARRFITRRRSKHELYATVFDSPEGKLVLKHIARSGFIFRTTFVPGQPERTTLNEGRRGLALDILKFVNKDPSELLKLIEEHHAEEKHANIQATTNGSRSAR